MNTPRYLDTPRGYTHYFGDNYFGKHFLIVEYDEERYDIFLYELDYERQGYQIHQSLLAVLQMLGKEDYLTLVKRFFYQGQKVRCMGIISWDDSLACEDFLSSESSSNGNILPEDILGIEYITNPMPSTSVYKIFVGYKDDKFVSISTFETDRQTSFSEDEFNRFRIKLVNEYKLNEWESSYSDLSYIDGHTYSLIIHLKHDKFLFIGGFNAYPPHFDDLMMFLKIYYRRPDDISE